MRQMGRVKKGRWGGKAQIQGLRITVHASLHHVVSRMTLEQILAGLPSIEAQGIPAGLGSADDGGRRPSSAGKARSVGFVQ